MKYLNYRGYPYPELKTTKKIKCGERLGEEKYVLREEAEIVVKEYYFEPGGHWVRGVANDCDTIYFKLDRDAMFISN